MRLGVHRQTLADSLGGADEVWLYAPASIGWDVRSAMTPLGARAHVVADLEQLLQRIDARAAQPAITR